MTANQLKAQENELKREELEEKKRTGRYDRQYKAGKAFEGVAKGAGALIGAINDPSWYNLDKALVNDVAQFPYGKPIGIAEDQRSYRCSIGGTVDNTGNLSQMAFPGVMRLEYVPTVGDGSQNESDAINVAMRNVYAFVRHANSGSRNYDAPDLMQYMLTMDSIYSLISHCSRAYSIALTAKSSNRYWPTKMLDAAGFTTGSGSITENLAQFRAAINMAVQKASIFNVPAKFPYFNRHIWMSSNIFKDGAYKRCRNYVFVPSTYYGTPDINGVQHGIRFFSTNNDGEIITSSITNWKDFTGLTNPHDVTHMSFTAAVALLKHLIDTATANEDYGIMSGDILKAFGDNGVFKLQSIGEDFHVESVYSPEVLTQIQGATILPGTYFGADIAQTSNGIIYQGTERVTGSIHTPTLAAGIYGYEPAASSSSILQTPIVDKVLINMYKDEVTPDDNMVATRLSNIISYGQSGYITQTPASGTPTNYYVIESKAETCASEIIDGISIFCNPGKADFSQATTIADLNGRNGYHATGFGYFQKVNNNQDPIQFYSLVKVINAFEWAPRIGISINANAPAAGSYTPVYDNLDLANYIFLDKNVIRDLHAVALLSLFAVPLLGNTARKY